MLPAATQTDESLVGQFANCTFDGKGMAACVGEFYMGDSTLTQTYTGSMFPYYTLTVEGGTTKGNSAVARLSIGFGVVFLSMVLGFMLAFR
jgi:hypothetical protein